MLLDRERPGHLGQWWAGASFFWLLRPDFCTSPIPCSWHDIHKIRYGVVFTLWKSANTNKSGLLFSQSSISQHTTCSLPSSRLFWSLWQATLAQRSSWGWWGCCEAAQLYLSPCPIWLSSTPIHTCWSPRYTLHAEFSLSLLPGNSTCNSYFFSSWVVLFGAKWWL